MGADLGDSRGRSPQKLRWGTVHAYVLPQIFWISEILSIIHSFIPAISIAPLQVLYNSEALPIQHGYCVGASRRSAQATAGKELVQGPYVAEVEPTTLRLKVIVSTKAPSRPTIIMFYSDKVAYVPTMI